MLQKFVVLLVLFASVQTYAAIAPLKAELKKTNRYIAQGVIQGGQAQRELILQGVRRSYSVKNNLDRIVFEMSPKTKGPGRAGFFHVAFQPQLNRIVIDVAGLVGARIALDEVVQNLKRSPFIADAALTLDPEDRSGTLEIKLKGKGSSYRIESFELKGEEAGRLVLDILKPVVKG